MIIANANDAIEYLKKGEVIGYPTEAVYGIGCDPWNKLGVEKVAKIKRRPLNKPFLMVASSIEQLDDLVDVTKLTNQVKLCLLYTSPSPRDRQKSRMPSSA